MAGRIGYDAVVFSVARRDGFEQSGAPRDELAAESPQSVLADLSCVAAVAPPPPPPRRRGPPAVRPGGGRGAPPPPRSRV